MAVPADSIDSLVAPRDSIYRLLKGFRNVKIYRSISDRVRFDDGDQHRFDDPPLHRSRVVERENNQITSDVMDIFTRTSSSRGPSSSAVR